MTKLPQESDEVILACAPEGISIDELFSDVERVIFFDEFHFLLQNPGLHKIYQFIYTNVNYLN